MEKYVVETCDAKIRLIEDALTSGTSVRVEAPWYTDEGGLLRKRCEELALRLGCATESGNEHIRLKAVR